MRVERTEKGLREGVWWPGYCWPKWLNRALRSTNRLHLLHLREGIHRCNFPS